MKKIKNEDLILKDYVFYIEGRKMLNINFKNCSNWNVKHGMDRVRFTLSADEFNKTLTAIDRGGQCQLKLFKNSSNKELQDMLEFLDKFHLREWVKIDNIDKEKIINHVKYLMDTFPFIESESTKIEDDFGLRFWQVVEFYKSCTQ